MGDRPPADSDSIQFDMNLGGMAFGEGIDIPLDIDVPGRAEGRRWVRVRRLVLTWFGISESDGFIRTNDLGPRGCQLEVNSNYLDGAPLDQLIPPFVAQGQLLFFHVTLPIWMVAFPGRLSAVGSMGILKSIFKVTTQVPQPHRLFDSLEQVFVVDMGIEVGEFGSDSRIGE